MNIQKKSSRKIAALVFLTSTLITAFTLQKLDFNQLLSLTGALTTAAITTGIWLETSYRFLVKEATAPLDKLTEKL